MTESDRPGPFAGGLQDRPASCGEPWAIVLAGGDGTRLGTLTRDRTGNVVPKQFCSLTGGASLLEQTVARANAVVSPERITTVVCAHHAHHWTSSLHMLDARGIVVQPANRGTALGILLPLLRIIERDPDACIVILPSDHYVHDEAVLEDAMRTALTEVRRNAIGVALLGIEAEHADPELGYIVPGCEPRGRFETVRRFVEKPPAEEAGRLCREGAVWNSFIVVCRARSLLDLYMACHRTSVETLRAIACSPALAQRFSELPSIDFSRDVVTGQETQVALVRMPPCGWNDLGTPERVARTLARYHGMTARQWTAPPSPQQCRINLAARLMHILPEYAGRGPQLRAGPASRATPQTRSEGSQQRLQHRPL